MNYKQQIDNHIYELNFEEVIMGDKQLKITSINDISMQNYICIVKNIDIKEHKIINNIDLLYNILISGLQSNNKTVTCLINITDICIILNLTVLYEFVNDNIILELKLVKDTNDIEKLNNKIQHLNIKIDKMQKNFLLKMEQMQEEINLLKYNTIDVEDYFMLPYYAISDIRGITNLRIYNNQIFLNNSKYEIKTVIHNVFDTGLNILKHLDKFIKLKNLLEIYIENSEIESIKYFIYNKNLKGITLKNCDSLKDISHIVNFTKLENIIIENCKNIQNLHLLEELPNLKTLKVDKHMNTNVFSTKNISFNITIM